MIARNKWIPALFLLAATLMTVTAANAQRNLGFTDEQILAMGSTRWLDLFSDRIGTSTADMIEAQESYTRALRNRNNRLLAKEPEARRQTLQDLQRHLPIYGSTSVLIQRFLAGGGTMYSIFAASAALRAEEVIYQLITGRGERASARTTSQITNWFPEIQHYIGKAEYESEISRADAMTFAKENERTFDLIARQAAKLSRADSDRVLNYCYDFTRDTIRTAREVQ
ncbi:MAG: hypothetical protein ACK4P3_00705 [Fimbriimonadaceae bacterium]